MPALKSRFIDALSLEWCRSVLMVYEFANMGLLRVTACQIVVGPRRLASLLWLKIAAGMIAIALANRVKRG